MKEYSKTINLNNPNIMSAKEAAKIWGLNEAYVRISLKQNPEKWNIGSYRKFGSEIIVTTSGMEHVTSKMDPRRMNMITEPDDIKLNDDQRNNIMRQAFDKANHEKRVNGGNTEDYLQKYVDERTEYYAEINRSNQYERTHFFSLDTDIGGMYVDVDGEKIFVRNSGIDGAMPVSVIDDPNMTPDRFEKSEKWIAKEPLLEGKEIKIPGTDVVLTGKYQAFAQEDISESPNIGRIYLVKIFEKD